MYLKHCFLNMYETVKQILLKKVKSNFMHLYLLDPLTLKNLINSWRNSIFSIHCILLVIKQLETEAVKGKVSRF